VSASCVLVASRVINRTRMSCIARWDGYAKCPTVWRFSYSFILRYFIHGYTQHTPGELHRQCSVAVSWHCL